MITAPSWSGEPRLKHAAVLDVVAQPDLLLEHDERANPARREPRGRTDKLLRYAGHRYVAGQEGRRADPGQRTPNIRLKNHHQDHEQRTEKIVEQPIEREESQQLRADESAG